MQRNLPEVCRTHAEALTEAVAKVGVAAETAVGGYLDNALVWLFNQQLGSIFQTELLDVVGHL